MSLSASEMTPADIAAVTNNRSNSGGFGPFGGDGSWFIIILFLFNILTLSERNYQAYSLHWLRHSCERIFQLIWKMFLPLPFV